MSEIRDYLGVSYTVFGFVLSTYGLGRLVIDPLSGYMADRINNKHLLLFGTSLVTIGSIFGGFSTNLLLFSIGRMINGVGLAICATVGLSALSLIANDKVRGRALNTYFVMLRIGGILSPGIVGFLASLYGWRIPFFVHAITAMLAFITIFKLYQPKKLIETEDIQSIEIEDKLGNNEVNSSRLRKRRFFFLSIIYFCAFSLFINRVGFRNTIIPLFGSDVLGLDSVTIGLVLTLMAVMALITVVPSGWLADKYGPKNVLVIGFLLFSIGVFCFFLVDDLVTFIIANLIVAVGMLNTAMPSISISNYTTPTERGKYMGIYRFFGDIGTLLGPLLLGAILDTFGFNYVAIFSLGLALLTAAVSMLLR